MTKAHRRPRLHTERRLVRRFSTARPRYSSPTRSVWISSIRLPPRWTRNSTGSTTATVCWPGWRRRNSCQPTRLRPCGRRRCLENSTMSRLRHKACASGSEDSFGSAKGGHSLQKPWASWSRLTGCSIAMKGSGESSPTNTAMPPVWRFERCAGGGSRRRCCCRSGKRWRNSFVRKTSQTEGM